MLQRQHYCYYKRERCGCKALAQVRLCVESGQWTRAEEQKMTIMRTFLFLDHSVEFYTPVHTHTYTRTHTYTHTTVRSFTQLVGRGEPIPSLRERVRVDLAYTTAIATLTHKCATKWARLLVFGIRLKSILGRRAPRWWRSSGLIRRLMMCYF